MTEAEWLSSTDPRPMLEFLQFGIVALVDDLPSETERQAIRRLLEGKIIPRKLALFACACCREIWQVVTDVRSRTAVEVAEQNIDDLVDDEQLGTATQAAHAARNAIEHKRGDDRAKTHIRRTAANACYEAAGAGLSSRIFASSVASAAHESADVAAWIGLAATVSDARAKQAQILRCLVGNPFRPFAIEPALLAWRDGTITKLAQAIYDDRSFDGLPVLADALEEAGCLDANMLAHCRLPGKHFRGCWVLDKLTAREQPDG